MKTDLSKLEALVACYCHANDLNPFQKRVIKAVLLDLDTPETIEWSIKFIRVHRDSLAQQGWKPDTNTGEQVNGPSHYLKHPLEPTFWIVTAGGFHWCIENFLKYVTRYPNKNGLQDLDKAERNLIMYGKWLVDDAGWSLP